MPELEIRLGAGTGDEGCIVTFRGDCFVLGRSRECDYVLTSDLVSRRHCRLERLRGRWVLTDLGSTGGTYVDGERVRKAKLRPGAKIVLGTRGPAFEVLSPAAGPAARKPLSPGRKRRGTVARRLGTITSTLLLVVVVGGLAWLVLREKSSRTDAPDTAASRDPAPAPGRTAPEAPSGPSPWSVTLSDRIRLRPVVVGGRVWAAAGRSVVALDAEDGRQLWDVQVEKPCRVAPVPTDRGLLVIDGAGVARLVDPRTGGVRARRALELTVQAAPAARADLAYLASVEGPLLALRLPDLTEAWRVDLDAPVVAGLAVIGDRVVSVDVDGRVRAHDGESGKEAWTCGAGGEVAQDPAMGADRLVVSTAGGALVGIDLAEGSVRFRTPLDESDPAAPAAAGSTACVVTRAGEAVGIDLADGTVRWRRQVEAAPRVPPTAVDSAFAVACRGGEFLLLDARDGTRIRRFEASGSPGAAPATGPAHLFIPIGKTLHARPLESTR